MSSESGAFCCLFTCSPSLIGCVWASSCWTTASAPVDLIDYSCKILPVTFLIIKMLCEHCLIKDFFFLLPREAGIFFFTCRATGTLVGGEDPGVQHQVPGTMFTWWLAVVFTNQLTHKSFSVMFSFVTESQEVGRSSLARLRIGSKTEHRGKADVFQARWCCKIRGRAVSGRKVSVTAKCLLVSHPDSLEQWESVLPALFQLCLRCCVL